MTVKIVCSVPNRKRDRENQIDDKESGMEYERVGGRAMNLNAIFTIYRHDSLLHLWTFHCFFSHSCFLQEHIHSLVRSSILYLSLSFALKHSIIYLKWYDELWQCHSTKNEIVKLCIFCMIHARVRIPLTMRIQFFPLSAALNAHTFIHKVSLHRKLRVIWRTCGRRNANK